MAMEESDFIVLGSGTSAGTPRLNCIVKPPEFPCACIESMKSDPMHNKDYRLNPSILFRVRREKEEDTKYVLVDACKTFRESAVRWFPYHGVPRVDAVLFTHEHSDATLGLEDLQEATEKATQLPLYMSETTFVQLRESFAHLVHSAPEHLAGVGNGLQAMRKPERSDPFRCTVIARPDLSEAESPPMFSILGLAVVAFPVLHGTNNVSLGFVFGKGESKFVYISDIFKLPEASEKYLQNHNIELLMVDAIHRTLNMGYSHQSVMSAIKMGLRLRARRLLLIGMGHTLIHKELSEELPEMVRTAKKDMNCKRNIDVEVTYDGMLVSLKGIDL